MSALLTQRYATHYISATTPVLCRGNFWWVTSLNIGHWSKCVMHATHVVIFTINNDVALTSSSQCKNTGRPTGWLVNSGLFTAFSHELSQKVPRHYNRNVMNIGNEITNTSNWMANNARALYIWYNFEIVPWNRTKFKKRAEWLGVWWQRY